MRGTQKLICELTLRDGKVVYDLNGMTREDWNKQTEPGKKAPSSVSKRNTSRTN
jgi:dihydroorotase